MLAFRNNRTMISETLVIKPQMEVLPSEQACGDAHRRLLAINDAMAVLGGKWKISLIGTLSFKGKRRFSDLLRDLDGIGPKMLAKELRELEANRLITRTVRNTRPITVEYEMTSYGHTLSPVICEIVSWGTAHRAHIMKGQGSEAPELVRSAL
jgi:DNA-binding HxlR family transcriptional regulator